MKPKLLIGTVAMFLLLSVIVSGGLAPTPVAGRIYLPGYSTLEGLTLYQENLRTREIVETKLDANGYYIIDWSNYPFLNGDKVEIKVKVCEERAECKREVTLNDGEPVFVDLVIPPVYEVVKEEKTVYLCANGSEVASLDLCPPVQPEEKIVEKTVEKEVIKEIAGPTQEVIKEVTVIKYHCSDGTIVDAADGCPVSTFTRNLGIVTVLLAVLSAGLLGLYYKNRKKYKWVPGFLKTLEGKVQKAKKLKAEGKDKQALKALQTVEKTANTLTQKHLKG